MPKKDTVAKRLRVALAQMDPPKQDKEVAKDAGVSAAWLGAVKQGHIKNPPTDKLVAVARVTGVDPFFLTEPLDVVPITETTPASLAQIRASVAALKKWTDEEKAELYARIEEEAVALHSRRIHPSQDLRHGKQHERVAG